jgi:hypothetical protein
MWQLESEAITKQYRSGLFSRAFLLSALCCIFAFVVPILILVSIGCTPPATQTPGTPTPSGSSRPRSPTRTTRWPACSPTAPPSTTAPSRANSPAIAISQWSEWAETRATTPSRPTYSPPPAQPPSRPAPSSSTSPSHSM